MSHTTSPLASKASDLVEQAPEPIAEHKDSSTELAETQSDVPKGTMPDNERPSSTGSTIASRPMTDEQKLAENTLIEAFPAIEAKVVRAVLVASGGKLEQAFNALLGMSDPDFNSSAIPDPAQPTTAAQRQMQQDELYARQLAQHYQTAQGPRRNPNEPPLPVRPQSDHDRLYGGAERERNFFDDDLPEIKEGVKKTFIETQTKFTNWMTKLQKRLDGDDDDPYNGPPSLDRPDGSQYGRRPESHTRERPRRSGDTDAFDADPQVIGDDFQHLELRDDYSAGGANPPLPGRPAANPNLFKPTPPTPPQSGPVDEVDAVDRKTPSASTPMSGAKSAKWQPLTSLEPRADTEENDPFSVGDEGEDDADDKTTDLREADSTRLKKAAKESETVADVPVVKELVEHEKGSVSNKDKTAEALLTGTAIVTDEEGKEGTPVESGKKDDAIKATPSDKA